MQKRANVADVAAYILKQCGEMTAMKLQKLVYYAQAWSLVWDERPLFQEEIQAWANGPVVPELYSQHHRRFSVAKISKGNPGRLDATAKETVDAVLEYYGDKTSHWLSELTHIEPPWREARGDTPFGKPSKAVISHAAMAEYYGSLTSEARETEQRTAAQ